MSSAGRVGVELLDDAGDERGRLDVFDLVDDEALAPDDAALAHVEHLHARFERVLGEADEVVVLLAGADHLLALDRLAHARELVADAGRELELELVGGVAHPLLEPLDDRVVLAVEEVEELLDELHVLVVVDVADARRRALLDVRVEARPAEPVVAVELRPRCTCGSGTCAAGGRASRGSRTRARTARSSARPCAAGPASPSPAATPRRA